MSSRALVVILQLVHIVASDRDHDNAVLLASLTSTLNSDSSPLEASSGAVQQLMRRLLPSKAYEKEASPLPFSPSTAMTTPSSAAPSRLPEIVVTAEWRQQLLNRLTNLLPPAYQRLTRSSLSSAEESAAVSALADLLADCRLFLGEHLTFELTVLLLGGLSSSSPLVAQQSAVALSKLSTYPGMQSSLSILFKKRLLSTMSETRLRLGSGDGEDVLLQRIQSCMGLSLALGAAQLSTYARQLAELLMALGAVEVSGIASAACLQSRAYHYSEYTDHPPLPSSHYQKPAVHCGYYRVVGRYLCDKSLYSWRCWVYYAGPVIIDTLLLTATESNRRWKISPYASKKYCRLDTTAEADTCELNAWNVLSIAVLALRRVIKLVDKRKRECAVCNIASFSSSSLESQQQLSVCTGCRRVFYCGAAHQRQHWSTHKKECRFAIEVTRDNEAPPSLIDPEIVLYSASYMFVPAAKLDAEAHEQVKRVVNSALKSLTTLLGVFVRPRGRSSEDVEEVSASEALSSSNITLSLRRQSVQSLLTASLVECMANCAFVLGEAFRPLLVDALYPLLEAATESDAVVKQAALSSLARIALYSGYDSIAALLVENVDYVVDCVCLSLRSFSRSRTAEGSRAPRVLDLVLGLSFSTPSSSSFSSVGLGSKLMLIRDSALDALDRLDRLTGMELPDKLTVDILRLLLTLVRNISAPLEQTSVDDLSSSVKSNSTLVRICSSLTRFHSAVSSLQSPDFEGYVDNENNDDKESLPVEGDDAEEESTEEETIAEALIKDILRRCNYFLSSKRLGLFAISLVAETFKEGLLRLARRRRVLLPVVHLCWSPVSNRMMELVRLMVASPAHLTSLPSISSTQQLLLASLFDLCTSICRLCGDFFVSKLQDKMWPALLAPLLLHFGLQLYRPSASSSPSHIGYDDVTVQAKPLEPLKLKANTPTGSQVALKRFSPGTKGDLRLKEAMLRLIAEVARSGKAAAFTATISFGTSYLLLPLLHSSQDVMIQELAVDSLVALCVVNPLKIGLLLDTVHRGGTDMVAARAWDCLTADVSLLELVDTKKDGKLLSAPFSKSCLELAADSKLRENVKEIILRRSDHEISPNRSLASALKHWSSI